MRRNYNYIKLLFLLIVIVFLCAFSNIKNAKRVVGEPNIVFTGDEELFITEANVSKLLIQNSQPLKNQSKETLDLNEIEQALNNNPVIKEAEVFLSVKGKLTAKVKQKKPIARVFNNGSYYLDEDGGYMPLSKNYTARVPIVTGRINKSKLDKVYTFAKAIYEDEFLKKFVIEIHQNTDETIDFKIRKSDFIVHVGTLNQLEKKLNNFKAFYQKASKDNILDKYKRVNLKFDTQVICTKI